MLWWTLRQLNSSDTDMRKRAAEKLGESGNVKAVEPLIAALKDSNDLVRKQVAEALGKIGDVRAIKPLVAALKDAHFDVRETATKALVKMRSLSVEPLIATLENSEPDVRLRAGEVLRELNYEPADQTQEALMLVALQKWDDAAALGSTAVKSLIIALEGSDHTVRRDAAKALGKTGDARAVEPLIAALKDADDKVHKNAAKALVKIGSAAFEPLRVALKDPADSVRHDAAEVLGKIGDVRAVEPLILALNDSSYEVRSDAAQALGKIGDARAALPLLAALNDHYGSVRENVAAALVKIGPGAIKPLVSALEDGDANVRFSAGRALRELDYQPPDQSQRVLMLVALKEWDDVVALGSSALEPLIAALNNSDHAVRSDVAGALGRIGDARAVEPLIAALKDVGAPVRQYAAEALGKIGDTRAVEPLIAALKDSDWGVRVNATQALAKLKYQPEDQSQKALMLVALRKWADAVALGPAAVEPLLDALKNFDDVAPRDSNAVLEWIGDVRAVEPLIAVLKDPKKDWLRSAAAKALGRIGDLRAVQPLVAAARCNNGAIAIQALERMIRDNGRDISPEDLQSMAQLQDSTRTIEESKSCGNFIGYHFHEERFDCSQLRQLARQELIRRGIEA